MSRNLVFSGKSLLLQTSIFLALATLVACASATPNVQSIPVTANPSEQIDALAKRIDQARQVKAPVLSPTWFSKADASLAKASKIRSEGGSVQEILDLVAQGNAQVEQANKFTKVAENLLPAVIQARADARAAGGTSLGEPYEKAEKAFIELTTYVEDDNVSSAERGAGAVESEFRAVELQAIKASSVATIRDLIEKAKAEGAEKLVPRTLAETQKMEKDLDAFITGNRYASAEMGERAGATLFQANRLLSLTREAAAIKKSTPEDDALQREQNIAAVGSELSLPDLRDRGFASQVSSVINAARELRKDRDYLVAQTNALRDQLAKLQGQSSQQSEQLAALEQEQRLNELYTQVSGYFTKEEAEVYKQGTQLVVRLRGVQFPVGQAILQPTDYQLLSKVQKAIRSFGDPTVVIEGHTDTTGSVAVNDQLSQERAEAVEMYLVANNTLPQSHIRAVGKGSSEPLAPNDTTDGRAYNRRIDIRIDPAAQSIALPSVGAGAAESSE